MSAPSVRRVTDPHDLALVAFGRIQEASYYAPETLIPPAYFPQLLQGRSGRQDRILVAEAGGKVLGGTIYSLLSRAGFSSFMGVSPAAQGQGVGRALQQASLAEVRAAGLGGMFADSVHASRQSAAEREAEARTGSDPVRRREVLGRLGFRVVDLGYWQPIGGENGGPIKDLDLLFCPFEPSDSVALDLVLDTMSDYWRDWMGPERTEAEARALAGRSPGARVPLLPASETPHYWQTL